MTSQIMLFCVSQVRVSSFSLNLSFCAPVHTQAYLQFVAVLAGGLLHLGASVNWER